MNNLKGCLCLLFVCASFLFSGCAAPRSQFVLLPSPDGHPGKVTVASKGGETKLAKAYESTDISNATEKSSPPVVLTEGEVNTIFKEALAAQPDVPVTYLLYFAPGSSELTQESAQLMSQIVDYIRKKESNDISISGHSDKVGSRDVNIRISRERAEAVATLLQTMGIAPEAMEVASHGMELPLVDTKEGVPEPRNRRVELVVR